MNENELFARAIGFASLKHKDQVRKDGTPYIYHPLKVAELVKDAGFGLDYQMVALLHDVLEDTDATEDEVRVFGEDVLEAVKLLTRPEGADEAEYVAAILQNHMAAVVKNADKIHNMWDVGFCDDREWGKRYVKKVKKYYEGKFSYALDDAIGNAEMALAAHNSNRKWLYYSAEKMKLNME